MTFQFVDAISASPTVLLDLDDGNPFTVVAGSQLATPDLREQLSYNNMRDGSISGASLWDDKEIPLVLGLAPEAGQEAHLAAIQKLIRLCNSPQWLKVQLPNVTNPVFLRTRRSSVKVVDDISDDKPNRDVTVTLRAEYAAYGLPETGTFTINNDPTSGTNPMSYVFPTVKGDVAAPLVLSETQSIAAFDTVLASLSSPLGAGLHAPLWVDSSALAPDSNALYTITTDTNSLFIGGSAMKVSQSAALPVGTEFAFGTGLLSGIVPGNYRVVARVQGSDPARSWNLSVIAQGDIDAEVESGPYSPGVIPPALTVPAISWVDCGVLRLPAGAVDVGAPIPLGLPTTSVILRLQLSGGAAGKFFELDGLLFIPVGLDTSVSASWTTATLIQTDTYIFDGIGDQVIRRSASSSVRFTGSLPRVVPGSENLLTFVRSLGPQVGGAAFTDAKTLTLDVAWTYYPRYLYMRPAST